MVEGTPPSGKFVLNSSIHQKPFENNALRCLKIPFSASHRGKSFSLHFPQTENGRGFDSRLHIKRGDTVTQVPKILLSLLIYNLPCATTLFITVLFLPQLTASLQY